ncbi:hypothetical protein [Bradyrhizobium glycinis]|uniref:hypothetical protein n=1 Tax=Bradyrhizobium glycinis TaxID=2751812 RepID=UPI0018D69551|nr:hypothetical protein [Bradyrhizobium glycinis]MBH5372945.1 hypothetical protein [Bradyrhizobium glycinis]
MTEAIHKKARRARPSLRSAWKAASVTERRRFIAELLVDLVPRTPAPATMTRSTPPGDPTVDEFFARCVVRSPGDRVQSSVLYERYQRVCALLDRGPISHKAFSLRVSSRGCVKLQSSVIWWVDIKLVEGAQC